MSGAFDLRERYLSLDGAGRVAHHDGGDAFWRTVATRGDILGTLVSCFDSDADWAHWEMHPGGDEILFLVDGEMTLVLDEGSRGERRARLLPKQTLVVPKGVWHRALVPKPSVLLAITYGEGTQHRSVTR